MNCAAVAQCIDLYILGALGGPEREAMSTHVATCPRCQLAHVASELVASLLRTTVEQLDPPPALRTRLLTAVRARGESFSDRCR
jgi:anti-sigma factor RsiW